MLCSEQVDLLVTIGGDTPVWSPHHINLINEIEKVQWSFTEKMYCMSNLSYKDRLASPKIDSPYTRRVKQDLVMCYKIINGLICLDFSDFFSYVVSDRMVITINSLFKIAESTHVNLTSKCLHSIRVKKFMSVRCPECNVNCLLCARVWRL